MKEDAMHKKYIYTDSRERDRAVLSRGEQEKIGGIGNGAMLRDMQMALVRKHRRRLCLHQYRQRVLRRLDGLRRLLRRLGGGRR